MITAFSVSEFILIGKVELIPSPHELFPLTVIFWEAAPVPKFTVILFVVLVPVASNGNVQV